jgi:hypothetical protein
MGMGFFARVGSSAARASGSGTLELLERRCLLSGTPVAAGPEFQVNTYTSLDQGTYRDRCIDTDAAGNFVVAWSSLNGQDGSGSGVYAQRFDAAGNSLGGEFRVNGTAVNSQSWPSVAVDAGGGFVIAWESNVSTGPNSTSKEIIARRYDASGAARGGEFRVNTTTADNQTSARTACDDAGNFVVAWQSAGQDPKTGSAAASDGIYAQRYDASGAKIGGEFRVNSTTADLQRVPTVAMNGAGSFVVGWMSNAQDGSGWGVYGQRFNAAGQRAGAEFRANSFTAGSQSFPTAGIGSAGDVILAWESAAQDGDLAGIYAQRFDAAGARAGGEFRVNTYTAGAQISAAAMVDSLGGSVITWSSNLQDGSNWGVYGQRYDAAGAADGSEFRVNTTTAGLQSYASVAPQPNGAFVATWTSVGQDGSGQGVFAQRFTLPAPAPASVLTAPAPAVVAESPFGAAPITEMLLTL